jgi:hypothetical protein
MRYADEHTQKQFEKLQRKGGRPANSPDWGMLVAAKSGEFTSRRDPTERTDIKAGVTRVVADYWLAVERPELFKLGDKRDTRTYQIQCRNLEHAREELERGLPASRRATSSRAMSSELSLPGQPFRLPHGAPPFKLPRPAPRKVLP